MVEEKNKRPEKLLASMDQVPNLINLLLGWEMTTVVEVLEELASF